MGVREYMNQRRAGLFSLRGLSCCVIAILLIGFLGCRRETAQNRVAGRAASRPRPVPVLQGRYRAGEALFRQYCSPCHPDGGNVTDPHRTLRGSVLRTKRIDRPEDVVRIMRHPTSRMIRFDEETLSDRDALAIGEYVLSAFSE